MVTTRQRNKQRRIDFEAGQTLQRTTKEIVKLKKTLLKLLFLKMGIVVDFKKKDWMNAVFEIRSRRLFDVYDEWANEDSTNEEDDPAYLLDDEDEEYQKFLNMVIDLPPPSTI